MALLRQENAEILKRVNKMQAVFSLGLIFLLGLFVCLFALFFGWSGLVCLSILCYISCFVCLSVGLVGWLLVCVFVCVFCFFVCLLVCFLYLFCRLFQIIAC